MSNKRIILTNKETGQVLPEATLLTDGPFAFAVQFDGTKNTVNGFQVTEWTATYPRTFRNGTVVRPIDPNSAAAAVYYQDGNWYFLGDDATSLGPDFAGSLLELDSWEVV